MAERVHRFGLTPPRFVLEQVLDDDELVIYDAAPDLRAWIWTQWLELIVVVVVVAMIVLSRDATVVALGLIGEVVLLSVMAGRCLAYRYTRYVLTNHRVLRLSGVFRRDYEWISWSKVTDVAVRRSLADRWFGTATFKIQSANELSGFKEMVDVPKPAEFAQAISSMVNHA